MRNQYNTFEVADQKFRPDLIFGTEAGMALMDTNGILIKVNASLCEFLGYAEQELLGEQAEHMIHPEDLPQVIRNYRNWSMADVEFWQLENRYLHKQGHVLRGLARLSKIPFMDTFLIVIHLTDMTSAVQNNGSQTNWEIMKNLYHLNSDAVAVVDLEGKVLKVNKAYEDLLGYSEEEMINRILPTVPQGFLRYTLAGFKSRDNVLDKMEYESVKRTKDGRLLYVYVKLFPIYDESGNMQALGRAVKNITQQGVLTSQLHDLISFNLDPMLIFCPRGYVVQTNKAFTEHFGWPKERVLDEHWSRLPFSILEYRSDLKQLVDKIANHRIVTGFETFVLKGSGESVQIAMTGIPLKYAGNGSGGTAIILRDITHQKKTQQLMMESEKRSLAGQLAAAIAHEIRNPITSIKGFLKLLENFGGKPHYFEIVNAEIDRIELILSEMLELAKPQTVKFEPHNIRMIIDQVISLLCGEANMNNIEVRLHDLTDTREVYCDGNQIKQVFINFMKNAIEAMPGGGELTIEMFPPIRPTDRDLRVVFTDTGTGIPPVLLAKIGEPFFTTKQKGTGLGFMTSKSIIENHNGKINITSKPNKGTSIEIRLPLGNSNWSHA